MEQPTTALPRNVTHTPNHDNTAYHQLLELIAEQEADAMAVAFTTLLNHAILI